MALLSSRDETMTLGIGEMDATHREFVDLLDRLASASGESFATLFEELVAHTEQHFANETRLMEESACPARQEHEADHRRVLGELKQFQLRVRKGQTAFAKEYLRNRLPEWFALHLATLDSVLAAHLQKAQSASRPQEG